MMSGGSPIFVKTFEMLAWLLEHTKKFPKHQRFVMAQLKLYNRLGQC